MAGLLTNIPNKFNFTLQVATDRPSNRVAGTNFWLEHVGNNSPGGDEFSSKFARSTLYAYVPDEADVMFDFINSVLGFSYVDGTTLKRINPLQHPKYRNLWASRITDSRGIQYEQRKTTNNIAPPQLREYAGYDRRLCAVEFAPVRWKLKEDSDVKIDTGSGVETREWLRNVEHDNNPKVYDVSITPENQQFFYQEGPPVDKGFQGEINYLEVKSSITLRWRNVPETFVYDTVSYDFGLATKISAAAGKVNSATWAGYPAGTLLLLEPEIDRYLSGTLYSIDGTDPKMMCDVMLPIIHFDPPNLGTYKGHNLKPWWGTETSFIYYLVTNKKANASAIRIYQSYDFKKLFEHWSV